MMMTRPIGGCDDERARARVHRPTRDRSIDRSRPSSRRHPPVASSRPRIHSLIRSRDRSVGRSMERNGMEWNGMDGHHIHPSTTHIQTDDTYIHDNRPIIIYYIQRARDRPTHAPHHHPRHLARARRHTTTTIAVDARVSSTRRRTRETTEERTNERTRLSRLGR